MLRLHEDLFNRGASFGRSGVGPAQPGKRPLDAGPTLPAR